MLLLLHGLFAKRWQLAFSQENNDLLDCSQATDRLVLYRDLIIKIKTNLVL